MGANLGITVVNFARKAKQVFAFEPHPANYSYLIDQIKIRGLENKVSPFNIAVSDAAGDVDFFGRESHGIHSLGAHNKGKVVEKFKVSAVKLDDFWTDHINQPIGLLKIDVEGFETDVLKGAQGLLANKKVEAVVFEFSPRIYKLRGLDIDAPIKLLQKHGYKIFDTEGQEFELDPHNVPKICDLVALPNYKNIPT